jgi:CrcB protein
VLLALQPTGGNHAAADEQGEDHELLQHTAQCTERRAVDREAVPVAVKIRRDAIGPIDPELDPAHRPPSRFDVVAAFVGGAIGTLARYGFDRAWPEGDGAFPHTTNVINTIGAFAIGVIASLLARHYPDRHGARAFLITGLLGGWTTMSALGVADARIGSIDGVVVAVWAAALSFAAGVLAAHGGVRLAERFGATELDVP